MQENKELLPVMEHFYTIQGEGYNTGKAAYFIRLGGCDVGCTWCDVKASWNADLHPKMDLDALAAAAQAHNAQNIVVTGGEPLLHNLDGLCAALHQNNFKIWIETSGSSAYSGNFDWVCVSPKKFKPALPQVLGIANELKVVVYHKSDIQWAVAQAQHCAPDCLLYLQPEWSKQAAVLPLIIDFVQQNPRWRISLQTHKYLNIP
jgi:organic radical activating enzyme